MFRAMGHENVAVLNGGLPDWVAFGLPTESKQTPSNDQGDFMGKYQSRFFKNSSDILMAIDDLKALVLDARSLGRFEGIEPESRAGLRGGHIPGSVNLHFEEVTRDGKIRPETELEELFRNLWSKSEAPDFFL